jgi:hypothetical protein
MHILAPSDGPITEVGCRFKASIIYGNVGSRVRLKFLEGIRVNGYNLFGGVITILAPSMSLQNLVYVARKVDLNIVPQLYNLETSVVQHQIIICFHLHVGANGGQQVEQYKLQQANKEEIICQHAMISCSSKDPR